MGLILANIFLGIILFNAIVLGMSGIWIWAEHDEADIYEITPPKIVIKWAYIFSILIVLIGLAIWGIIIFFIWAYNTLLIVELNF